MSQHLPSRNNDLARAGRAFAASMRPACEAGCSCRDDNPSILIHVAAAAVTSRALSSAVTSHKKQAEQEEEEGIGAGQDPLRN